MRERDGDMQLTTKVRVSVGVSLAWLLFWIWAYLDDPWMSAERKFSNYMLVGLFPVAVPWAIARVLKGSKSRP